ncbi:MAG: CARDB domain-containing protein, partial [Candidatus Thermoplasmatota archaeon]
MTPPIVPLFTRSLKGWFSAKGFWLVVAAALLPLVLTGAWVTTHRADVAIEDLRWNTSTMTEGDAVHFTAVVKNAGPVAINNFNASLAIGTVAGGQLFSSGSNETLIDHLAPGASKTISFDWNATASTQQFFVLATADTADTIAEIDEFNNQNATPVIVGYRMPDAASAPKAPDDLAGDANATSTADLVIESITIPEAGENRTVEALIKNNGPSGVTSANFALRMGQDYQGQFFSAQETTARLDLASGESKTVSLAWTTRPGAYWAESWVEAPNGTYDTDGANNHATKS